MSRWFRFYESTLDDPKVQKLPDTLFRAWVNILCLASRNNGTIPPDDVAFCLRVSATKAGAILEKLRAVELIDGADGRLTPHNWNARQYKSDVSTERVQQHRERQRNVSCNVSVTSAEAEQKQRQIRTESKKEN